MPPVVLLGPQRDQPTVRAACESTGAAGTWTMITTGCGEREREHEGLVVHVGREAANLRLFARAERVLSKDPELFNAVRARDDVLRELRTLYRLRLDHAMDGARALQTRAEAPELLEDAFRDALEAVAALDRHHLLRVREVRDEFNARWMPAERDGVAKERRAVAREIRRGCGVMIAGGHVAVLLDRMRLLGVGAPLLRERPVVAWSAGAMALTERVVLFHDSPPQGRGNAEVLENGLGLVPGLVALPHARRRLLLELSHDVLELLVLDTQRLHRLPELVVQAQVLDLGLPDRQVLLDDDRHGEQVIAGLGDVVVRAAADRLDGDLVVAFAGDHDDRQVDALQQHARHQFQPRAVGQIHIRQDHVGRVEVGVHRLGERAADGHRVRAEMVLKRFLDQVRRVRVVLHHQQADGDLVSHAIPLPCPERSRHIPAIGLTGGVIQSPDDDPGKV